ncbi:MAG: (E)-4-hydroxy-3-methylbut-2-enyl-diphosphate synthase [Bacteroidales bacterium]|nr:(E)-4-hydroxy-3-methylbut-2-enyl-diphosphate synthase [Bacteroidales bacterium]
MELFNYKSRIVNIGDVPMGGNNPIRIQSMTSTKTMDTEATVAQSIRMIEAGCEYIRITAPGIREAEHLAVIKNELKKNGYSTPLIADIHFQPKAAEVAARIVEKVRINPGNYTDRNKGKVEYSESEYAAEVDKIRKSIRPLINVCKEYGTAIRIGSNHGSLAERILNRYGDTPLGMVESALEFVRICEDLDFHNIILSMKASNVKIMVQANRLLVQKMIEEGMNYPLHLGVTEAGDAEDGRIKSAAGIGSLLMDGIGDTIRVSLTEDPENEIPVAMKIVQSFGFRVQGFELQENESSKDKKPLVNPFQYNRKISSKQGLIGDGQPPVVILNENDFNHEDIHESFLPDYLFTSENKLKSVDGSGTKHEFKTINANKDYKIDFSNIGNSILVIKSDEECPIQKTKKVILKLVDQGNLNPIILKRKYSGLSKEEFLIRAADCSYLLVDGIIDGIWLQAENLDSMTICETAFGILQATGDRISKTEYIACPSCGRTLFNIQETLQKIKSETSNLKGLKIAVMGCIVNGPGEMADADYGYVGTGPGKITLYRRNLPVKKNINEDKAVDEMIKLIKADGNWIN